MARIQSISRGQSVRFTTKLTKTRLSPSHPLTDAYACGQLSGLCDSRLDV